MHKLHNVAPRDHTPFSVVVVDTDGGLDDALALLLLCHASQVSVAGVGSVHGNVTADAAASNMARMLELANNHTVPVARGAREPLAQPLELAHPDDLVAALIGAPTRALATETAADQLIRLARQHSGTLDLLTLGPLTNVARALQEEPELPRHVRRVVAMAGAVEAPGNTTDYAESNVWHDPEAAAAVVAAGFGDLTLVPLDVTREATATREWLHQLATAQPPSVWSQAATAFLAANEDAATAFPLHDALAAAILLDPKLATHHRRCPVQVAYPGVRRGQTYIDGGAGADPVTLIARANVPTFRERLLAAMLGRVAEC